MVTNEIIGFIYLLEVGISTVFHNSRADSYVRFPCIYIHTRERARLVKIFYIYFAGFEFK